MGTGVSQEEGMKLKPELFQNLDPTLELAVGSLVVITANLAVEHGIMNGTRGILREILYTHSDGPSHANVHERMPHTLLIDCPEYSGPPFFDVDTHPERRTWIPLRPREHSHENRDGITRIQFPVTLGWAMTTEKAQGMTLRRACISINQRGGQPGNLFTAMSRVCHVDDLMLDDFPSMQTIMKQRESINFHKRQAFERNMRVLFSKTLRRHLRDK